MLKRRSFYGKTPAERAAQLLADLSLEEAFCYYDRRMNLGMHDGDYIVSVGTSCMDIQKTFEIKVRNGKLISE